MGNATPRSRVLIMKMELLDFHADGRHARHGGPKLQPAPVEVNDTFAELDLSIGLVVLYHVLGPNERTKHRCYYDVCVNITW